MTKKNGRSADLRKALVIAFIAIIAFAFMGCPSVNLPMAASGATVGAKTGQSSGTIYLGLFGDAKSGMLEAAKAGGITKIATVDTQIKEFIGPIILTFTTTVTGE